MSNLLLSIGLVCGALFVAVYAFVTLMSHLQSR